MVTAVGRIRPKVLDPIDWTAKSTSKDLDTSQILLYHQHGRREPEDLSIKVREIVVVVVVRRTNIIAVVPHAFRSQELICQATSDLHSAYEIRVTKWLGGHCDQHLQ
jgi:hypothetical protein